MVVVSRGGLTDASSRKTYCHTGKCKESSPSHNNLLLYDNRIIVPKSLQATMLQKTTMGIRVSTDAAFVLPQQYGGLGSPRTLNILWNRAQSAQKPLPHTRSNWCQHLSWTIHGRKLHQTSLSSMGTSNYWLWTMSPASLRSRSCLQPTPGVLMQHWKPSFQGTVSLQPLSLTMGHIMLVKKCSSSASLTDSNMSPAVDTFPRVMGWQREWSKQWRCYWRNPATSTWKSSVTEPLLCPGVTWAQQSSWWEETSKNSRSTTKAGIHTRMATFDRVERRCGMTWNLSWMLLVIALV